jgi:prepilin-type N-terminal cleavage/methylation domain-containing protein/prepilin-type processing-associated H-X9-DG protein
MRRAGFTLIELLVVIAIIAILAAILFPVFERAKNKAQQAACINNLKQIAMAILMYAHDWDDMVGIWSSGSYRNGSEMHAAWGGHDGWLWPYIQNEDLFCCPNIGQFANTSNNYSLVTGATAARVYSYISNACYQDNVSAAQVKASDWTGTWGGTRNVHYDAKMLDYFPYPTHFITFFDGIPANGIGGGCHIEATPRADGNIYVVYDGGLDVVATVNWGQIANMPIGIYWTGAFQGILGRHTGMVNCAFLDGHVQALDVGTLNNNWKSVGLRYSVSKYYVDANTGTPAAPGGQYYP